MWSLNVYYENLKNTVLKFYIRALCSRKLRGGGYQKALSLWILWSSTLRDVKFHQLFTNWYISHFPPTKFKVCNNTNAQPTHHNNYTMSSFRLSLLTISPISVQTQPHVLTSGLTAFNAEFPEQSPTMKIPII